MAGDSVTVAVAVVLLIVATPTLVAPDRKVTLPFSAVPTTVAVSVTVAGSATTVAEVVSVSVDAVAALIALALSSVPAAGKAMHHTAMHATALAAIRTTQTPLIAVSSQFPVNAGHAYAGSIDDRK